jgi:hypothetical protein
MKTAVAEFHVLVSVELFDAATKAVIALTSYFDRQFD